MLFHINLISTYVLGLQKVLRNNSPCLFSQGADQISLTPYVEIKGRNERPGYRNVLCLGLKDRSDDPKI